MKAIKTFRDLMVFLHTIPLGKAKDFVMTLAKDLFHFLFIVRFIRATRRYVVALEFIVGALLT